MIREHDSRFINMPVTLVSLINGSVWTAYAVLKKDIPLFMTNALACTFMMVNVTFYLWAKGLVQTSSIQMLISFFELLFPKAEDEAKLDMAGFESNERRLDLSEDEVCRTKAEIQARFNRNQMLQGRDTAPYMGAATETTAVTEDTRLAESIRGGSLRA